VQRTSFGLGGRRVLKCIPRNVPFLTLKATFCLRDDRLQPVRFKLPLGKGAGEIASGVFFAVEINDMRSWELRFP